MRQATALVIGQFILFTILLLAFLLTPTAGTPVLRIVGLLCMGLGLALVLLAFLEHARSHPDMIRISPEPNQRAPLVTTGLYKRIRHPIYTGVLLGALGVGLVHGGVVTLLVALAFIPFFTYKSIFEERRLQQVYLEYHNYQQRSGRFLPWF